MRNTQVVDEIARSYAERVGEAENRHERWHAVAALNVGNEGGMQAGGLREGLLGQVGGEALAADTLTERTGEA